MLNNAAVSWRSILSTALATSTDAAELIALCSWARKFLSELGFPQLAPTIIFEDNAAAKDLAEQSIFKGKNKQFELQYDGNSSVSSLSAVSFVLKRSLIAYSWQILAPQLGLNLISFGYL
jgi:hypothetical protein